MIRRNKVTNNVSLKKETMIEETIHIHDKYQCEIKLGYQLDSEEKSTIYDIETYLFFPYSLGITRHTYSKNDFYNDIHAYIRLKTPTILLPDMVKGKYNPLKKLHGHIEELLVQINQTTIANYECQIKLFCCIFKSAIRDHVSFLSTRVTAGDSEDVLVKYLASIQAITKGFRALRSLLNVPTIDKDLFSIYSFGDEYLSLLIESYTYELLEHVKKIKLSGKDEYFKKLLALIAHELAYRKMNGYPSIPEVHATNEGFIFRTGVLKKYMGSILFLNTRIKPDGEFLQQIVFALAAGIAMIFAVGAMFFAQSAYTSVSLPVFIVLVVSYMFKDRIKELTREYLGNKLRYLLFDFKMNIYNSSKEKIGWCKESVTFIKDRKIPQQIMKIRNRDHIIEIENEWFGEVTILYKKRIKLFRKKLEHAYSDYRVESINDIMRLNIVKFLSKMDDPKKPVYILDGENYQKTYGKRVYYVNMIMKYSMKNTVRYKRFRMVLSRNGIKRIEEVMADEEYTR